MTDARIQTYAEIRGLAMLDLVSDPRHVVYAADEHIAELERMLETEYNDPTPKTAGYQRWYADLRASAERGT